MGVKNEDGGKGRRRDPEAQQSAGFRASASKPEAILAALKAKLSLKLEISSSLSSSYCENEHVEMRVFFFF